MACYQCFAEDLSSENLCAVLYNKFFGLDAGSGRNHLNRSGKGHSIAGDNVFHRADVFHGLGNIDSLNGVVRAAIISVETYHFQSFWQGYLQVFTFVFGILGKPHKSEYGVFGAVDSYFLGHGNFAGILHAFIIIRNYDSPGVLVYRSIVAVSGGLIEGVPEIPHRVCRQSVEGGVLYTVFNSPYPFELTPHRVGLVCLYCHPRYIKCRAVAHRRMVVVAVRVIGIVIGV